MTIDQMRGEILKVYPGDAWKYRVARMHDNQVIAVYYSFKGKGKFDKPKKLTKRSVPPIFNGYTFQDYEQLSFDDVLVGM